MTAICNDLNPRCLSILRTFPGGRPILPNEIVLRKFEGAGGQPGFKLFVSGVVLNRTDQPVEESFLAMRVQSAPGSKPMDPHAFFAVGPLPPMKPGAEQGFEVAVDLDEPAIGVWFFHALTAGYEGLEQQAPSAA